MWPLWKKMICFPSKLIKNRIWTLKMIKYVPPFFDDFFCFAKLFDVRFYALPHLNMVKYNQKSSKSLPFFRVRDKVRVVIIKNGNQNAKSIYFKYKYKVKGNLKISSVQCQIPPGLLILCIIVDFWVLFSTNSIRGCFLLLFQPEFRFSVIL